MYLNKRVPSPITGIISVISTLELLCTVLRLLYDEKTLLHSGRQYTRSCAAEKVKLLKTPLVQPQPHQDL